MNAKRWIAIFLALVLILSLVLGVLPNVFAAEAYTIGLHDGNHNFQITADPGDTVEAYLCFEGNPGILSAGVLVDCPDGVEITKAESALSGHNFTAVWQCSKSYGDNPYLVWMLAPTGTVDKALVTYNGNWCKLTFQIGAELAPGDYAIGLSAPKDKNLTAETASGVIKPNTNTYVTGISVLGMSISVQGSGCNHTFGEFTVVKEPTAEAPGLKQSQCSRCGEIKEEEIPYTPEETTEATTEATTEVTTAPDVTTGAEPQPSETLSETLPSDTVPQETTPDAGTQEKATLKTVIILASGLLLGVLLTITVLMVKSVKTKE